jgi:hypothetical protein
MREQVTTLPMSHATLELAELRPRWWQWTLVTEDARIALGAEVLATVGARAVRRLSSGGERAGEVDGREVCWVLSLAEKHHSLYCAVEGLDRVLYFQDGDGRVIWRDRLSPEHLKIWTAALEATG